MAKRKTIKPQRLIKILDKTLYKGLYGDIKRANKCDAKMAVFILGSCFIDAMASFCYGVTEKNNDKNTGKRFKDFVKKYLPEEYDAKKLWKCLRCSLMHNYTEGGSYLFVDGDSKKHLQKKSSEKSSNKKTYINLEDFLDDLDEVYKKFCGDISKGEKVFENAKKHLFSMRIIGL